ncbi:MAG: MFS transporter [Firmicutes bacterium]|nr:MFS transporter [Bacillota bacterium]
MNINVTKKSEAPGGMKQILATFKPPEGNARALVASEPFWGTVISWYNLYGPLYMVALGVSKTQVGLITAIGLTVQVLAALLGGYFSDHFGRKRTMQIADAVGWVIPSIIWLSARSTIHFFLAAALNGLFHAAVPAWGCLLVEDTKPEKRQPIYAMVQMMFVGSGLLVPIGGLLVKRWGIITGGRIIYGLGLVLILCAIAIRQRGVEESSIGQDIAGISGGSPKETLEEFIQALRMLKDSPTIFILFLVQTLAMFSASIRNVYSAIYMTDSVGLGLSPSVIALVPATISATMILMLVLFVPRLRPEHANWGLQIGAFGFTIGSLAMLLAPPNLMLFPLISSICIGFGTAIFEPIRQASLANAIPDRSRAKMNSVIAVFTLISTIPAGPAAGLMYKLNPRLPFAAVTILYIVVQFLILQLGKGKPHAGQD